MASVLRAYHRLEGSMTRHLSDDGAIVSARASALSLAYDLVRERDPRLW